MLTLDKVYQASYVLKDVARQTDLIYSQKLSGESDIYLKTENLQVTGSFKLRGAYYKISRLSDEQKKAGIIACSAGNHAQGVALAASRMGIKSVVCMPDGAPISKVEATKALGAEVRLVPGTYDDAYEEALRLQKETGATFIHPFDDDEVIAGQGTIGIEILEDLPTVDVIVVPAGGGGLLAGVAACVKQINPRVKIIGVQAEGAPAIAKSFKEKSRIVSDNVSTIADGIQVKAPGEKTMEIINEYADDVVLVTDAEISAAILLLLERTKQVVEPAGATTLAAVLNNKIDVKGKKVACLLSGGNIDVSFIHRIIELGLVSRERKLKFSTTLLDIPGSLEHLSHILAEANANIVMVQHDRLSADIDPNEAIIHIACEVGGREHGKKVVERLEKNGYKVVKE
ncbi:MAG: threonine ammonia-lyase [Clostridia bacterium]|nr:threonine ammonia-lyase [Clostridia bacterium]